MLRILYVDCIQYIKANNINGSVHSTKTSKSLLKPKFGYIFYDFSTSYLISSYINHITSPSDIIPDQLPLPAWYHELCTKPKFGQRLGLIMPYPSLSSLFHPSCCLDLWSPSKSATTNHHYIKHSMSDIIKSAIQQSNYVPKDYSLSMCALRKLSIN